jgi:hypothetical protein
VPIRLKNKGVVLASGAILLVVLVLVWLRFESTGASAVWRHLPTRDAAVGFVDVAAIRQAGLVGPGSSALREPEYEDFIKRSGFNWEKDLDRVTWSFTPTAKFFLVDGRFDWPRLETFVKAEGGECKDGFCTVRGSQPGREISFFALRPGVMALAVSADRYAADQMRQTHPPAEAHPLSSPPQAPLWVHFSKFTLETAEPESPGMRGFARILRETDEALVILEPADNAFRLRLEARCASPEKAQSFSKDLTNLTALLNRLLGMEKATPGEADFATVLAGGTFSATESRLQGIWPVSKSFLSGLVAAP